MMKLSKLVMELRIRGMSQNQLAGWSGIAASSLSAAFQGKQPWFPGWRKKIASTLGVAEAELFTTDGRLKEVDTSSLLTRGISESEVEG